MHEGGLYLKRVNEISTRVYGDEVSITLGKTQSSTLSKVWESRYSLITRCSLYWAWRRKFFIAIPAISSITLKRVSGKVKPSETKVDENN